VGPNFCLKKRNKLPTYYEKTSLTVFVIRGKAKKNKVGKGKISSFHSIRKNIVIFVNMERENNIKKAFLKYSKSLEKAFRGK